MSDETTTPTAPPAPAAAAPAAAPAAPAAPDPVPGDPMVSAALLRESQGVASALEHRVVELEAALQAMTGERDVAVTSARRLSVRAATGIDDDQIADMAHARWSAAMEGADEPAELGAWWKATAADEGARGALPKALQVYLPQQAADAPAAPVERRGPGTPGHQGRRTPTPGDTGALTPEKFARLSADDQRQAAAAFWSAGRRRTRR